MKILTSILSLFLVLEIHSQEEVKQSELSQQLIREWVATEKLLGQEKSEWLAEKAHVSQMLDLYVKELTKRNEELEKTGKAAASVDETQQKLETAIKDALEQRKKLADYLRKLQPRFQAIVKKFPESLQQELANDIEVLNGKTEDKNARDLLQAMINTLEAAARFNRGIYRASEAVTIGEVTLQAQVMYLGLGRAFFVVGDKAGIGMPAKDGWEWKRDDSLAASITKAMDIQEKKTHPQLIKLPVQVKP